MSIDTQSHTFSRVRGYSVRLNINRKLQDVSENEVMESYHGSQRPPHTYVQGFHIDEAVKKMTYTRLGTTDMFLSTIALGCGPLGQLYGPFEGKAADVLYPALQNGVNFIDTAYWYGQGHSEELLSEALRKIPRRSYYISTKIGRFELDYGRVFDFRADSVLHSIDDSLKRLRLKYIDIAFVQIQDLEFCHENIMSRILNETLSAVEMARLSGKVRYIGITGYSLRKLAYIVDRSPIKIDAIMTYCRGTMIDNVLGEFVQFFTQRSVGIVNASSFALGLLTPQGPPPWHPSSDCVKFACQVAYEYCKSKRISITRLANNYSLNFPGICTCVIGAHNKEVLMDNLEDCWRPLNEKEVRVRERIIRRHFDPLENEHWEGIDLSTHWKKLNRMGLTALPRPGTPQVNGYNGIFVFRTSSVKEVVLWGSLDQIKRINEDEENKQEAKIVPKV